MRKRFYRLKASRHLRRCFFPVLLCLLSLSLTAAAQEKCLKPGRVEQLKKQLEAAASDTLDQKLKDEIIRAGTDLGDINRKTVRGRDDKPDPKYLAAVAKVKTTVCEQLNTAGWPTVAAVGRDGTNAFMYLVSRALPIEMQLEIYPVVVDAFRLNQLDRDQFLASYIDRLQLATGNKQLFGSQAYIRDGFLVLAPIDRPSRVDERRKEFKMEPLRSYERYLEATYQMPLIRAVTDPENPETPKADGSTATERSKVDANMALAENNEEVMKVATSLVTLDVVVAESSAVAAPPLDKGDFRVLENGRPVEIESFSRADSPFDIVLLLDMSGSTSRQKGLIRKSTSRFVEMKRAVDRVAVVSFNDTQTVVSELEADKGKLLQRIKDIEGGGGSFVWDSIKFAQDLLDKNSEKGRRKAIVIMSDGVDNALLFDGRFGSRLSFADLVESVQYGNTAIFPVFLDTSSSNDGFYTRRIYSDARHTLEYLAGQSAGRIYAAKNLEDLSAIYDRVLKDVGTVYSIGFSPSDEITDTKWRRLKVELPAKPGLKLWHRPGYFPRQVRPPQ
jgi:VWFA-related protein